MSLDPYYVWLGIPPKDQPADHYRLLGLRRFEPNLDVIDHAAERQSLTLRSLRDGPNGPLAKKLIEEISSARDCLLTPAKKSDYDTSLREKMRAESPTIQAPPEPAPTARRRWKETEGPAPEGRSPEVEAPSVRGAKTSDRSSVRADDVRLGPNAARLRRIIFGSLTVIGACLVLLWWFGDGISSRDRDRTARSDRRTRPRSSGVNRRNARPSAPEKKRRAVTGGSPSVRSADTPKPDPQDSNSETASHAPDPDADRAKQPESTTSDNGPDQPDSSHAPPDVAGNPTQMSPKGTAPPEADAPEDIPDPPRATQPKDLNPRNGSEVDSAPAASVFSQLPNNVDLAKLASPGSKNAVLGELAADHQAHWDVQLEDYASPLDQSRFRIGAEVTQEGARRWPVERLPEAEDTTAATEVAAKDMADADRPAAYVEIDSTELVLRLADSAAPKLIEELSVCSLTVTCDQEQHFLQLSPHHKIPPTTIGLEDSDNTMALDHAPVAALIDKDRIVFEIRRIEMGIVPAPSVSVREAGCDKEILVPLDPGLPCDLGIKLTLTGSELRIVSIPWYKFNDRRRRLVTTDIEKDVARVKSQYTKSVKEFNEARAALTALPREVRRIGRRTPRNPAEAAAQRAQIARLDSMGTKLQSRVRRLSNVGPGLEKNIKLMVDVLALSKRLPKQFTLHFRIYAKGNTGDFLMVRTESDDEPGQDEPVQAGAGG